MPQFDISVYFSQFFWLSVIFGVLYFIIRRFIVPSVEQIFQNRDNLKESYLQSASSLSQQIKELEEGYESTYKDIVSNVDEIKHKTLRDLNTTFESRKKELSIELDKQYKDINEWISISVRDFRLNKESFCIGVAGFIIKKITNKEVNQKLLMECYKKVSKPLSS